VLPTSREPGRRDNTRSRVRIALLVFTALALITLDFRGSTGVFGSARDTTLTVLGPVRTVADAVLSPFRNAWHGITDFDDLEAENAELRLELADADNSTLEVADLRRRLREFELLSDLRQSADLSDRVIATVIDEPLSNFERTIELNKGSNDGIEVGMPVEAGRGLVGRVVQTVRNRSRVELVTDASFGVGVRLVRSGDVGVARGNGDGEIMTIEFVGVKTVVIPGESVVTSGLDGSLFPSGILVGTVVAARPNPVTGFQEVDIAPVVNTRRLNLVQVVLFTPPIIDNRPIPTTTTTTTTTEAPTTTDTEVPTTAPVTAPTRTTVTQVIPTAPSTSSPDNGEPASSTSEGALGPDDTFVAASANMDSAGTSSASAAQSEVHQ
jgi:rod shape-determining protein MreC